MARKFVNLFFAQGGERQDVCTTVAVFGVVAGVDFGGVVGANDDGAVALRGGVEQDHAQARHEVAAQDVDAFGVGVEHGRELLHGEIVKRRDADGCTTKSRAGENGVGVALVCLAADGGRQHQRMYGSTGAREQVGTDGAVHAAADTEGVGVHLVECLPLVFQPVDEVVGVGGEVHCGFPACSRMRSCLSCHRATERST